MYFGLLWRRDFSILFYTQKIPLDVWPFFNPPSNFLPANIILVLGIGVVPLIWTNIDQFGVCQINDPTGELIPYYWVLLVIYMIIPVIVVSDTLSVKKWVLTKILAD